MFLARTRRPKPTGNCTLQSAWQTVGTVTLIAHDVGTEICPERSPWLAALYVLPEDRHRGIGAVDAAAAKATALGAETLYLETYGPNVALSNAA